MTGSLSQLSKLGYSDTGPVQGSDDYTTIVMIHGYGFHGSLFRHIQSLAATHNARFVTINRRDYPGSEPLSAVERSLLNEAETSSHTEARKLLSGYMRDRAKEIFDFLGAFVAQECPPEAHKATGGIVLCSWSFANTYMTSLLANVESFSGPGVDLTKFIHRIVLFDPPYHSLGYPPPPDPYHPLFDQSIQPSKRAEVFASWVSGYYTHNMSTGYLERRVPDTDVRPTLEQLTAEETQACFSTEVASPGGSDFIMLDLGIKTGLNDEMRARALELPDSSTNGAWSHIPLSYLWGNRSGYEIPWGMKCLSEEVNEAKASQRRLRPISFVCLYGANHFYHWDNPERCLAAFLDEDAKSK